MVFRYCLGMTMSVSTLMIFSGAATPSSVVNLSIDRTSWLDIRKRVEGLSRMPRALKGNLAGISPHVPARLSGTGLDCLHILVREAEMMADLVDQHVANDI